MLDELGILAFEAMIMKNNEIVRESELLTNQDKIKIINMIQVAKNLLYTPLSINSTFLYIFLSKYLQILFQNQ